MLDSVKRCVPTSTNSVHVLGALRRHRAACSMHRTLLVLLCIVCTAWVASAEPGVQQLPSSLLLPPEPVPRDAPILSGLVKHDPAALGLKPRAVLGYVSDKAWALLEFLAMMHASWRHLMADPATGDVQLDIFAFTHPAWAEVLSNVCTVLDLDEEFRRRPSPTCYVIIYPVPPQHIWHGYPYINNVHFFADERVASILTSHYGYVMKSDFDTYLTPALLRHTPSRLLFGIQEYGVLPETRARLVRVADDLGFRHKGRHNLGPTWLGDAATIIDMANRTIPVLHHILTQEFEQLPEGGIKQRWLKGEGFPLWSAGMAAMYATELIANHFIKHFDSTLLMDMHADSSLSVDEVLHIHCRHGDGDFSKFEFFSHHYDRVDLSTLDISVVKDYAMHMSVSSWRMLNPVQGKSLNEAREEFGLRDEL